MTNHPASHYPDIGILGEELVAQWLRSRDWTILHRRWRCRWGEIDIVAKLDSPLPALAFVEVKTRSSRNWDAGGLLAITPQKQAKLRQAAECYLTSYPDLAELPCRFDVSLVHYQKLSTTQPSHLLNTTIKAATGLSSLPVQLGQVIRIDGYQLILQEYLLSAFD